MPTEIVPRTTFIILDTIIDMLGENNLSILIKRSYYILTNNHGKLFEIYLKYQKKNTEGYQNNMGLLIYLDFFGSKVEKLEDITKNLIIDENITKTKEEFNKNIQNLISKSVNSQEHILIKVQHLIHIFNFLLKKINPYELITGIVNIEFVIELYLLLKTFENEIRHQKSNRKEILKQLGRLELNYLDTMDNITNVMVHVWNSKFIKQLNNKNSFVEYYLKKTIDYLNLNKNNIDNVDITNITLDNKYDKQNLDNIKKIIQELPEAQLQELKNIITYCYNILKNRQPKNTELLSFFENISEKIEKKLIQKKQEELTPIQQKLSSITPIIEENKNQEEQKNKDKKLLIIKIIQEYNNPKQLNQNIQEYIKKFTDFKDFITLIKELNKKFEITNILEKLENIKSKPKLLQELITQYKTEQNDLEILKQEIKEFENKTIDKNQDKIIKKIENFLKDSSYLTDLVQNLELQELLLESLNIEKNLNNCKISSWLIEKFYQKNKFQDFDAANQIAKKIRTVLEEIFQNQTLEENQNLYALKIYFLNIDNKKYKDNILKKPINTQLSETTLEDSQNLLQTGQKYNLKNDNFTLYMPNNQNYESFFNYFLIPSNTLNDKEFQKILEENLNYGKILNSQESGIGLKIIGPQLAELRYSNNTTRVFFYTFEINKQKIAIVKKIETNANRNHDQKNYINLDNSIEITKYRELAQDFLQLIEKNQEIRENKQLKIPETTRKVQPKGCTKII